MPSESITSPPYPGAGTTALGLYARLDELHTWAKPQAESLNALIGREAVPALRPVPKKTAYLSQPLQDHYAHFVSLRRIREAWDQIVRDYEDAWDDPHCVRQRAILVAAAVSLLNTSYAPFEVREARRHEESDRLSRLFEHLRASTAHLLEPYDGPQETRESGE